jgi:multidrug efflux pump subunit AcrB
MRVSQQTEMEVKEVLNKLVGALIDSGLKRAYPIFLTTLTTIAGLYNTLAISGLF